jgi:hypothetical protein
VLSSTSKGGLIMNNKKRFMNVYYKLPHAEKSNVIYLDKHKRPYSWNVCKTEIERNTEFGKKILAKLVEMEII